MIIGVCVLTDIAFAMLPWFFLSKLQLGHREKLITLGSLSLGFMYVTVFRMVSL